MAHLERSGIPAMAVDALKQELTRYDALRTGTKAVLAARLDQLV